MTLRGDRFCLPLKAGERRRITPGHRPATCSQTGQTVCVEPAETKCSWPTTSVAAGDRRRETRILAELNRRVDATPPGSGRRRAAPAGRPRARGRALARRYGAGGPLLARGPACVCAARHPLLEETLRRQGRPEAVVPLDLDLPDTVRVLVISGPNAGGKSVAMKTVGVLVLLAQSGWDVPAREDTRLPLVRRLFVDLGDEQSIEDALSSFSAHLTHLQRYLAEADADQPAAVRQDRVGHRPAGGHGARPDGPGPPRRARRARCWRRRIRSSQGRGARPPGHAQRRHGLRRADPGAALHPAPGQPRRQPRLRHRRAGGPGSALLREAQALVGRGAVPAGPAAAGPGPARRRTGQAEAAARDLESGLQRRQVELDARLADLDQELARTRREARRAGEQLLREWRRKLEAAVREVKAQAADQAAVREARREFAAVQHDLPESVPEASGAPPDLARGERVRVPHLGLQGRVTELRGDKVGLLADGLRLSVDRAAVERMDEPSPDARTPGTDRGGWTWNEDDTSVPAELDLRGLTADEAWLRLDRMLDRAVPVGLDQLTVVHGMGTGRLRDQLLARLARDPRVDTFHPGGERQSNLGATVVHLR
ncbi:MAG: Smr/MutS family protein [Candidatus Krumholzibacteriia bacterium]